MDCQTCLQVYSRQLYKLLLFPPRLTYLRRKKSISWAGKFLRSINVLNDSFQSVYFRGSPEKTAGSAIGIVLAVIASASAFTRSLEASLEVANASD